MWQQYHKDYEARLDLFRVQHYLNLQTAWQQRVYHPQVIGFSRQPLPTAPQQSAPTSCATQPIPSRQESALLAETSDTPADARPTSAAEATPTSALACAPEPTSATGLRVKRSPGSRNFQFKDDDTLLISILQSALNTNTFREQFIKERSNFITETIKGRTMLRILRIPSLFEAISVNKDMLTSRELAVFDNFVAKYKKEEVVMV